MEIMARFASPKLMAKIRAPLPREALIQHADEYIKVVQSFAREPSSGPNDRLLRTELHAMRLRELLTRWTPATETLGEIVDEARALLQAFGVPPPPCGWDAFEGWDGATLIPHIESPARAPDSKEALETGAYVLAHMEKALESYFGSKDWTDDAWTFVRDPTLSVGGKLWKPNFAGYHRAALSSQRDESAPAWVCEVPLPSVADEARNRIGDYLRAGVQRLWICDIQNRRIEVYTPIPDDPSRAILICVDEGDPRGSDLLQPREGVHFDIGTLWPERPQRGK
jgi:hypothetical protein